MTQCVLCWFALCSYAAAADFNVTALGGKWTKLADGPWGAREGLMVASVGNQMILTGGRGTHGVGFAGGSDVWRTQDGTTWTKAPEAAWGRRSYHILLGPDASGCLFLMGGQTFSHFYNDVWKTCDQAESWTQVMKEAPWGARAGLGGTIHNGKLVIAGGCHDNVPYDPGAFRTFYTDVWSSEDGSTWEQLTSSPGWKGRSGPRLVSFNNKLFLIAGEIGFTSSTQLADVWNSGDGGKTWSLVQASPSYSPRSGHGVVALPGHMVLIAGWPELSDIYFSDNGADWTLSSGLAWNCNSTTCGKYDFWPVVHQGKLFTFGGSGTSSTFGKLYAETWSLDLQPSLATDTVIV
jgi:N-acetylneuraminic acid mutarotase